MNITETLYVQTRAEWRAWLAEHYQDGSEIWLIGYRKATGRPSLPQSHAVEEALCFGWIDSIRKKVDEDRHAQRYTPRNPRSGYSQLNKERLARLIEKGMVMSSVLESVGDLRIDEYEFPEDIMAALKRDEAAWAHFQSTSPSYQRIRVEWINAARVRPEEFDKRLRYLIKMSAEGTQFGYGIEEFY